MSLVEPEVHTSSSRGVFLTVAPVRMGSVALTTEDVRLEATRCRQAIWQQRQHHGLNSGPLTDR